MRLPLPPNPSPSTRRGRRGERGTAVIVALVFLAVIFGYIVCNARTLHWLGREIKLIEHRQTHRLVVTPRQAEQPAGRVKAEPSQKTAQGA